MLKPLTIPKLGVPAHRLASIECQENITRSKPGRPGQTRSNPVNNRVWPACRPGLDRVWPRCAQVRKASMIQVLESGLAIRKCSNATGKCKPKPVSNRRYSRLLIGATGAPGALWAALVAPTCLAEAFPRRRNLPLSKAGSDFWLLTSDFSIMPPESHGTGDSSNNCAHYATYAHYAHYAHCAH